MTGNQKTTSFNRVHFSSKSYKWNSPKKIILDLDQEFHFDFDPAVPPRFGNFDGNGLQESWGTKQKPSRVFLNPPYKRKVIERWMLKAWKEFKIGNADVVVMLLPFRWNSGLRFLQKKGAELRICERRLKFQDADSSSKTKGSHGAPFDSVIAILQ